MSDESKGSNTPTSEASKASPGPVAATSKPSPGKPGPKPKEAPKGKPGPKPKAPTPKVPETPKRGPGRPPKDPSKRGPGRPPKNAATPAPGTPAPLTGQTPVPQVNADAAQMAHADDAALAVGELRHLLAKARPHFSVLSELLGLNQGPAADREAEVGDVVLYTAPSAGDVYPAMVLEVSSTMKKGGKTRLLIHYPGGDFRQSGVEFTPRAAGTEDARGHWSRKSGT